jgi:hypothetical protein
MSVTAGRVFDVAFVLTNAAREGCEPCTLHPEVCILNPEPCTLNHEP